MGNQSLKFCLPQNTSLRFSILYFQFYFRLKCFHSVDGGMLDVEMILENPVSLRLGSEVKQLAQNHTRNQLWNWDKQSLGSKSGAFFQYTQRFECNLKFFISKQSQAYKNVASIVQRTFFPRTI